MLQVDFNINSRLDLVAIYAAVLSTAIFIWEITKYRNKNHIKVTCATNMLPLPPFDKIKHLLIRAVNQGQQSTTITTLFLIYWPSRVHKFFDRSCKGFTVIDTQETFINPGEDWRHFTEQTKNIEKMAKDGLLYVAIHHSMGKKAIYSRIKIS